MSDGILDSAQVDALVEQADKGELPKAPATEESNEPREQNGHNRWLRVVDFTRPTKFGPEEENRMRRLHEAFCRTAGARLAGQHRIPMEFELIDTSQRTWRDAYKLVSRDAALAVIEIQPYGTTCLLAVEMPLLLLAIDKLLGSDDAEPHERKLTGIDTALVERVLAEFTQALTLSWQDLAEVEFELTGMENEVDAERMMSASEPSLAIAMEARLGSVSSAVVLLFPHVSVQPALAAYAVRTEADQHADPVIKDMLCERIGEATVKVRAEVGAATMGLHEVLALRPGDRIRLAGPTPGGADLKVDDITVYRTRAGRHGSNRAVQIDGPMEDVE